MCQLAVEDVVWYKGYFSQLESRSSLVVKLWKVDRSRYIYYFIHDSRRPTVITSDISDFLTQFNMNVGIMGDRPSLTWDS